MAESSIIVQIDRLSEMITLAHSTAHAISCFEDGDGVVILEEVLGSPKAGHSGADDGDGGFGLGLSHDGDAEGAAVRSGQELQGGGPQTRQE